MNSFVLTLFFCFGFQLVMAQTWSATSRSAALGHTAQSDTSEWNVIENPAVVGGKLAQKIFVGFNDRRLYGLKEYQSYQAIALLRIKQIHTGISLQKEGYTYFKSSQIGVHIAHQINAYQMGASLYYYENILGETEKNQLWKLGLGGTARIHSQLTFGCSVQNITFSNLKSLVLAAGIAYALSPKINTYIDFKNTLYSKFNFHLGIEYQLHPIIKILTGYNRTYKTLSLGVQIQIKYITCNYAFQWNTRLGNVHQLSCALRWNGKK